VLSACEVSHIHYYESESYFDKVGPQEKLCSNCFSPAYKMFAGLGLPLHRYSDLLKKEDLQLAENLAGNISVKDFKNYKYKSYAVGEQAYAGVLRFYARGELKESAGLNNIIRRYLKAGIITAIVSERIFQKNTFQALVSYHGIYVPHGIISD